MRERTIRLEKKDWDCPPDDQRMAILHALAETLKDTDVMAGRFIQVAFEAVSSKVKERQALEREHGSRTDTDLMVYFTLGEDSWRLKLGSMLWVQPRPKV